MNKHPCLIVRFILDDVESIVSILQLPLEIYVEKYWPHAVVKLEECADYWKFEGTKSVTYGVVCNTNILVSQFISNLKISWNYTAGPIHNVSINKIYESESAIWNRNNHPDEIFLLPIVEWVHVYTWPEV